MYFDCTEKADAKFDTSDTKVSAMLTGSEKVPPIPLPLLLCISIGYTDSKIAKYRRYSTGTAINTDINKPGLYRCLLFTDAIVVCTTADSVCINISGVSRTNLLFQMNKG